MTRGRSMSEEAAGMEWTAAQLSTIKEGLHLVAIPLLIIATVVVVFVLVQAKEVLVPFTIAVFLTYLLRPLVNLMTTPFNQWCGPMCAERMSQMPLPCCREEQDGEGSHDLHIEGADMDLDGMSGLLTDLASDHDVPRRPRRHHRPGHIRGNSGTESAESGDDDDADEQRSDGSGGARGCGAADDGEKTAKASAVAHGSEVDLLTGDTSGRESSTAESPGSMRAATKVSTAGLPMRLESAQRPASGRRGHQRRGDADRDDDLDEAAVDIDDDADGDMADDMGTAGGRVRHGQRERGGRGFASAQRGGRGDYLSDSSTGSSSLLAPRSPGHDGGSGGRHASKPSGRRHHHRHRRRRRHQHHHHRAQTSSSCRCSRIPRPLAVVMALFVALGLLMGGTLMIADAVQTFEKESLAKYEQLGKELAQKLLAWTKTLFNVDGTFLVSTFKQQFPISDTVKGLVVFLVNAAMDIFWVLLFILYLMFGEDTNGNQNKHSLRAKIDEQIQRYISLKTFISAGVAICIFVILGPMLRVNLAHLFAIFTFFFNYIPNVGPIVATALPLPVAILDPNLTPSQRVMSIVLPGVLHAIVGNVIEPKVFGDRLELHPVVVLLSLAFWFALWGVPGAILSVPITAVVRIVLSHMQHPYAVVMTGLMEGDFTRGQRRARTAARRRAQSRTAGGPHRGMQQMPPTRSRDDGDSSAAKIV